MATYNITGRIKSIGKTQEISEKFRKRELILLESVVRQSPHRLNPPSFQPTSESAWRKIKAYQRLLSWPSENVL